MVLSVNREDEAGGRQGVGTAIHCAHEMGDFRYTYVDWRPFQYFSCLECDPFSPLKYYSTYSLQPDGEGTVIGYTMGQPFLPDDAEGALDEEQVNNVVNMLGAIYPAIFEKLTEMLADRD